MVCRFFFLSISNSLIKPIFIKQLVMIFYGVGGGKRYHHVYENTHSAGQWVII